MDSGAFVPSSRTAEDRTSGSSGAALVDVAVVIPVYRRPRLVLEALESVAAQTSLPAQVVVVDNGSGDGTPVAVRDWMDARRHAFEVRVHEETRSGVSACRNRGLADAARHAFIAFLDSDDAWPVDFLARCVARLEADPAAVAASTDQCMHHPERRGGPSVAEHRLRSLAALGEDATGWLLRNDGAILSATVLRREVVGDLGGFDEALPTGQDWKLLLKASLRGRWLHAPGAPVEMGAGHVNAGGGEGHLSFRFSDRHRRWVRVLEEFLRDHEGTAAVATKRVAPVVAKRWLRAARELGEAGRFDEAIACLRQACRWGWRALRST